METRARTIPSPHNRQLTIKVIPGHFATSHSHINQYIDMTGIKYRHMHAKMAGERLATALAGENIDTVVCLDRTQMIAAYLAEALSASPHGLNRGKEISLLEPEYNVNYQMVFSDNTQPLVWEKDILLLVASATTGKTASRAMQSLNYYGGRVRSIAAIFSASSEMKGIPVQALFSKEDLPGYETYSYSDCPLCKENKKIDALVSSCGYSKL